ncbi:kinesin-related protein 4-like [Galleria mellonella]|uniref:Kinesin-related protein 4-like n=1 Tax=Galleria mellonella TaxID=7137 RepID=A0ABM3MJN5_GALME|nr:kinesin-related protein 4-like [Galleria mellonella]
MSDNIKVVVKVRPLISREIEEKQSYQWRVKNNTLCQLDQTGRDSGLSFTFDQVYDKDAKTTDVYNDIAKPIVEAATAGFNGTIFAYGQTSSGKTYTMTGTETSPGIIPLAIYNLFEIIKNIPNRDFLVRVSYIEIYNETLKDLLNIEKKNIKVHETFEGVKVDVTEQVSTSPEEVLKYLKQGEANRQTGATNMNEESSRSHSIFQIIIESREHIEGEEEAGCVNVSKLNLVDLAGSERAGQTGATGIRFKEGTHINKSLSTLALVIKQLSEDPNKHANYRDSKLTRILQNSLGGNAKTSIICAITPAAVDETISTLQFANRAKAIKNKPEVNAVATDVTMIQSLTKQLSRLQAQLESKKNLEVMLESKKNVEQDLQKQIENLRRLILNGFGQRSSIDRMGGRRKNNQLRRITISTLHDVNEEPVSNIPKFCTPTLKYNPMSLPGAMDFVPIQNASKLSSVPEETTLITPPPREKKVNFDDVIEIDSDDDESVDVQPCSPYHKCYGETKTPPCILRKKVKIAEKDLKDIVELTEREKMYTPSVIELLEKLDQNNKVIANLEDDINSLTKQSKDKDLEIDHLKIKITKSDEEMKMIMAAKVEIEAQNQDYMTKLTDWEVSYETLKQKTKKREEELLSLLDEHKICKRTEDIGKLSRTMNKELSHFMDMSKDISLVNSDNESSINNTNDDEPSSQIGDLVTNIQSQLTTKTQSMLELEANLFAQNQKVDSLNYTCKELEEIVNNYKEKLSTIEIENSFLKSTIETLNSTIKSQKESLEVANNDIDSYNSLIKELQIRLNKKDNVGDININDNILDKMIANEEKIIANNENIKNIIKSFKIVLDSRNKEIATLKSALPFNSESNTIEGTTEKELSALNLEIQNLKEQINENSIIIKDLLSEKNDAIKIQHDLSEELNNLKVVNSKLEKNSVEDAAKLSSLEITNQRLTEAASEQNKREQENILSNENLKKQIYSLSNTINSLECDLNVKNDLVLSLQKDKEQTEENILKAKIALKKIQDISVKLTGNIQEVPEVIDNFVDIFRTLTQNLDILESLVTELVSQREVEKIYKDDLSKILDDLRDKHANEFAIFQSEILTLTNNAISLKETLEHKTKELEETRIDLNKRNEEILELESKINIINKDNENLRDFVTSKDNLILSLKESAEKYENGKQEILLVIQEKEAKIIHLESHLTESKKIIEDKSLEIRKNLNKINDCIEEKSHILNNILYKALEITEKFNIETEITNDDISLYEQVIFIFEKIAHYAMRSSKNNKQHDDFQDLYNNAKNEVSNLTEQNRNFIEKLSQFENKNEELLSELNKLQSENKSLKNELEKATILLNTPQEEVTMKVDVIENIQSKLKEWESQHYLDSSTKKHIEDLQMEDQELKIKYSELSNRSYNLDDFLAEDITHESYVKNSIFNLMDKIECKSPPSLLTICCNKIIEYIQPSEKPVIPTNLMSKIETIDKETQSNSCQCSRLLSELTDAREENLKLGDLIKELESINRHLVNEQNEIRKEVQSLVEPAFELQKKVMNHRTNLSTLTATTYAENKSLKSQVKVLQHHHHRFHMLCQRDIPAVKKQLFELMSVLKRDSSFTDKHNISFKRYSLPDMSINNSFLSNFKTDETILDGDLLMLDTNITLTASADNTLMGEHEQTCLDLTHTFTNEVACQTNDIVRLRDSHMIQNKSETLLSNNENISEKLEVLNLENMKLREQLNLFTNINESKVDSISSPIKFNNCEVSNTNVKNNECAMCEQYKIEKIEYEKIREKLEVEIKELLQDLCNINKEKTIIEEKYNNLLLEIPSTDVLVRKFNTLEKEYNIKTNEIAKLTQTLNKKNLELKQLQEENDNLSTQIMENITEADDLNKELETVKLLNLKLSDKCSELERLMEKTDKPNYTICPQCAAKENMVQSLCVDSISQAHLKLNRSLSESDTSSRYNKICILQNELHASKEDCKELTEDVTTIKNHLDRNNLSMEQNMDLDDSMSDSNFFTSKKDFGVVDQLHKLNMPNIPEERSTDIYTLEKNDCYHYYLEISGAEKDNINCDVKILDLMKMLYNFIVTKHNNDVENFVNKLKIYENSKKELEAHVNNIKTEYSEISKDFELKDIKLKAITDIILLMQTNINLLKEEIPKIIETDDNTKVVSLFRENVLKVLDKEFNLSSLSIFEIVIDKIVTKNQNDLCDIMNKYIKLQEQMEAVTAELNGVNDNLLQMKCQLSDKENEYNLLKAQKEKVHEISNAVTLDIIKKEQELNEVVRKGWQKLLDHNIIRNSNLDLNSPLNVTNIFDHIIEQCRKHNIEFDKESTIEELKELKLKLDSKEKEIGLLKVKNIELHDVNKNLTMDLNEKDNTLLTQKSLYDDLMKVYESKVEENAVNLNLIDKLTEETNVLKENIIKQQSAIDNLESELKSEALNNLAEKDNQILELTNTISLLKKEINDLKTVNQVIIEEKENCASELEKSSEIIKGNKIELEKMTSDILILRESVKENMSVVESLKTEAKSLMQQNMELKEQFEEKCKDCLRLEMNIRTHEKTAQIQSKMIIRLQKQKESDNKALNEKDKHLEDLTKKYTALQQSCESMECSIKTTKEEIEIMKNAKDALQVRVAELEAELEAVARRTPVEAPRRRRQSFYDSKRIISDNKECLEDQKQAEIVFDSRAKPDDLFMDVDDDSSNRSTPLRHSKGRDSLQSRQDHSSENQSAARRRQRRQSSHDLHRAGATTETSKLNEPTDLKTSDSANESELSQVREQLASCKQELEELKERYKELDEECDTCAEYLRERESQCARLKKEKAGLENLVSELREKLQSINPNQTLQGGNRTMVANAAVNTDEDWTNLHSVVVDRMSYDAEVEKNKRLMKTVEELRFKKQELKTTLGKMQKFIEKNSGKDNRELETTKQQLKECKQELEELRARCKELDEECETCGIYLREKDEQLRKLKETKTMLEAKLQEFEENHSGILQSTRKKRQSLHDQNRGSSMVDFNDATTETSDDFLSSQVERDDSTRQTDGTQSRELKRLKMTVERLTQQKTSLERQLCSLTAGAAAQPMYIATGSAIVQNQQLTDVMKENQKLKKINAKLVNICKKRGKESNRENEDPTEHVG